MIKEDGCVGLRVRVKRKYRYNRITKGVIVEIKGDYCLVENKGNCSAFRFGELDEDDSSTLWLLTMVGVLMLAIVYWKLR